MGFWGTFDVDAFSLVQIWDIPKNFIASFMLSGGVIMAFVLSMVFYINKPKYEKRNSPASFNATKYRRILFVLSLLAAFILYWFHKYNIWYWVISSIVLAYLLVSQIIKMPSYINIVNNYFLRLYVTILVVVTIALCFVVAKYRALGIYLNNDIQIINIDATKINRNISSNTQLKLLGFLGDKLIVSSLDNKNIIVLKQDAFDAIGLQKK